MSIDPDSAFPIASCGVTCTHDSIKLKCRRGGSTATIIIMAVTGIVHSPEAAELNPTFITEQRCAMKPIGNKLVVMLFCAVALGYGQPRHGAENRSPGQIEKLKTMRLIEVLKLNEDDAARFVAKQRVHDDNIRAIMEERNKRVDEVEELIEGGNEKTDLTKKTEEIIIFDKKIFNERERYIQEMGKFLSPEQFAKFIIYDRNFNRKVRDAIEEMRDKYRERVPR
jgi:hypothetical protein